MKRLVTFVTLASHRAAGSANQNRVAQSDKKLTKRVVNSGIGRYLNLGKRKAVPSDSDTPFPPSRLLDGFNKTSLHPFPQIDECEEKIRNMEGALSLRILEQNIANSDSRASSRANSRMRLKRDTSLCHTSSIISGTDSHNNSYQHLVDTVPQAVHISLNLAACLVMKLPHHASAPVGASSTKRDETSCQLRDRIDECEEKIRNMEGALSLRILEQNIANSDSRASSRANSRMRLKRDTSLCHTSSIISGTDSHNNSYQHLVDTSYNDYAGTSDFERNEALCNRNGDSLSDLIEMHNELRSESEGSSTVKRSSIWCLPVFNLKRSRSTSPKKSSKKEKQQPVKVFSSAKPPVPPPVVIRSKPDLPPPRANKNRPLSIRMRLWRGERSKKCISVVSEGAVSEISGGGGGLRRSDSYRRSLSDLESDAYLDAKATMESQKNSDSALGSSVTNNKRLSMNSRRGSNQQEQTAKLPGAASSQSNISVASSSRNRLYCTPLINSEPPSRAITPATGYDYRPPSSNYQRSECGSSAHELQDLMSTRDQEAGSSARGDHIWTSRDQISSQQDHYENMAPPQPPNQQRRPPLRAKRSRSPYPKESSPHPKERSPYPKERPPYPKERSPYPKEKNTYPKERSPYPKERSPYPKERPPNPKERSPYPKVKTTYPKEGALILKKVKRDHDTQTSNSPRTGYDSGYNDEASRKSSPLKSSSSPRLSRRSTSEFKSDVAGVRDDVAELAERLRNLRSSINHSSRSSSPGIPPPVHSTSRDALRDRLRRLQCSSPSSFDPSGPPHRSSSPRQSSSPVRATYRTSSSPRRSQSPMRRSQSPMRRSQSPGFERSSRHSRSPLRSNSSPHNNTRGYSPSPLASGRNGAYSRSPRLSSSPRSRSPDQRGGASSRDTKHLFYETPANRHSDIFWTTGPGHYYTIALLPLPCCAVCPFAVRARVSSHRAEGPVRELTDVDHVNTTPTNSLPFSIFRGSSRVNGKKFVTSSCPNGSPLALLSFSKLGLRCNMFISGDQRPRISGGRCRN
eukprot:sb/3461542/